jgi:hypothetical protein
MSPKHVKLVMHMYFPPEEFFKKRDSFWKILVGETKKKNEIV